ncbi:uncharacterized protein LOC102053427 isoform X1 [Falco cherrug]|uniref:uncharacterized protein LOC102053427 isoform X1 n=1 Tax=Falco cherrug TaxID=345164 RepID=UPI002478E2E5|nr:uncharacterized protein LOC102053427 isoform X1 [Falco cherrug]XP_055656894.1 uncharacterized protein LOC101916058 isoform X1 [Falco peregrinus]
MAPSPLRKSPVSKIWGSQASTVGSKHYIRKALLAAGPCKQAAAFLSSALGQSNGDGDILTLLICPNPQSWGASLPWTRREANKKVVDRTGKRFGFLSQDCQKDEVSPHLHCAVCLGFVPSSREPLGAAQDDHKDDREKRLAALLLLRLLLRLGGQRATQGRHRQLPCRCCQLHDTCYNSLQSYRCNAKMQGYHYSWRSGSPSCREGSWCAQLSCECDRSLALCLKRSIGTYSKRYCFYPKLWCR